MPQIIEAGCAVLAVVLLILAWIQDPAKWTIQGAVVVIGGAIMLMMGAVLARLHQMGNR